ncbi:hypothetical protein BsWGS_24738 [Bradybaena similaris]
MKEKPILLVLYFCCVLPSVAGFNCTVNEDWLAIQTKCFTSQHIDPVKQHTFNEHVSFLLMNMLMEIYIKDNGDVMCKKQGAYVKTFGCFVYAYRQCTIEEYLDYIPDPSKIARVVPTLCNRKQKVNYECVKEKLSEILQCLEPESRTDHNHCKLFSETFDCMTTVLAVCGCETEKTFETIHVEIFHPSGCPMESDRHIIDCDAEKLIQASVGGAGEAWDHGAASLFVSLAFIVFELYVN